VRNVSGEIGLVPEGYIQINDPANISSTPNDYTNWNQDFSASADEIAASDFTAEVVAAAPEVTNDPWNVAPVPVEPEDIPVQVETVPAVTYSATDYEVQAALTPAVNNCSGELTINLDICNRLCFV